MRERIFVYGWQMLLMSHIQFAIIHSLIISLRMSVFRKAKRVLCRMQSGASSSSFHYPLVPSRSSGSCLRLLPRLFVTFILSSVLPFTTCFRRQFLRKMWPNQFVFRLRISCRIFLCSLTLSNTSSFLTGSVQLIFSVIFQHHILKLSRSMCFIKFEKSSIRKDKTVSL
jgi:hypothetical protein